ncbi:MAG: YitT family protein [Vallitaleaceae bacterium]|nr:YitT family protein [Vallitaleaceae bacterium]
MNIPSNRHPLLDFFMIVMGTTLLAISINLFFDPLELVTGGVTGIAIVLKSVTLDFVDGGIPIYVTNLVINIPLFVIAILIKGRNFGAKSLFSTIYLSFALYYTSFMTGVTGDMLLGSVFGGVLGGIGLGLVFAANATTGGTDLLASIIQHFIKHISVARIMFLLDALIVVVGLYIFGAEKTMYAIISIYLSAQVIDAILEGIHFSKAAFIISSKNEQISAEIMKQLDRGVTGLEGKGKYSKESKEVLLCVVSKRQIVLLKEIVRDIDKAAFVIVADVREVVGEGFIEYEPSKNPS